MFEVHGVMFNICNHWFSPLISSILVPSTGFSTFFQAFPVGPCQDTPRRNRPRRAAHRLFASPGLARDSFLAPRLAEPALQKDSPEAHSCRMTMLDLFSDTPIEQRKADDDSG